MHTSHFTGERSCHQIKCNEIPCNTAWMHRLYAKGDGHGPEMLVLTSIDRVLSWKQLLFYASSCPFRLWCVFYSQRETKQTTSTFDDDSVRVYRAGTHNTATSHKRADRWEENARTQKQMPQHCATHDTGQQHMACTQVLVSVHTLRYRNAS